MQSKLKSPAEWAGLPCPFCLPSKVDIYGDTDIDIIDNYALNCEVIVGCYDLQLESILGGTSPPG